MGLGTAAGASCGKRAGSAHILYRLLVALILSGAALTGLPPRPAMAQTYQFTAVEVEGNRRVETASIVSYAGLERGVPVSAGQLNDAYQRIFNSGLFETVELTPRGNTLVITVSELPTINRVNFEGNNRIKDEDLSALVESTSRRVFSPAQAERDAATIAEAYSQQGRIAARVTPRVIRLSDNRVDLVFEITEGAVTEVERVSFVGNRVFSDYRLRRVLETKQAGLLRAFVRSDTLIEDRIEFDKQVLRDFYLSRGYIDFRVLSSNVEFTRERDAFYLVMNIQEGQQFRFGTISTSSEIPGVDPAEFQAALKVRPGAVYSPLLVENSIARQERLAIQKGIDFLRVEPRVNRNDRDLTLDVEFVLTKGPRIFVERIDIEGNTTTLDRVVRQQFTIVEGDPFNPREIRQAAERIRALGFFAKADVDAREGSSPEQVVIDVNVEEQPTGSLNLGGAYSVTDGFGVVIGLTESNFLGRGQRLAFTASTAQESEQYTLGFTEPYLLGRDLRFDIDLGYSGRNSTFATYDTKRAFFTPALTFNTSENGRLQVRYAWQDSEMLEREGVVNTNVIANEIGYGSRSSSAIGLTYSWDSRVTGLNPNAGVYFEIGADYSGLGGDNEFVRSKAKVIGQTKILNEAVTLRATFEAGALSWMGDNTSRAVDRFILGPDTMRGFEPAGIGPRDYSNGAEDALGGNYYSVARFEAEFPLGLPEEVGLRGGLFYDIGNLWNLNDVDLAGAGCLGVPGAPCGVDGAWRQVIGFSLLWDTALGPLRFNFTNAIAKEDYDQDQSFDLTIQAKF